MENLIGKDQHSISIELNEKVNKFLFNSKDEKDEFIKSENLFCMNSYIKYTSAFDKLERKMFKIELEEKRLAHAVHLGFKQVAKTGIWNKTTESDDIVA